MMHHRDIKALADRRLEIHRSGLRRTAAASQPRKRPMTRSRIVGWLLMVTLLGDLFQMLSAHFEDHYVPFILTVLPVISVIALIRPQADRHSHGAADRAPSGHGPHRI